MKNKFYIYAYLDPRFEGEYSYKIHDKIYRFDYLPVYIGKGYTGKTPSGTLYNRMYLHLYTYDRHTPFYCWLEKIIKMGYNKAFMKKKCIIKIIDNIHEQEAFQYEMDFINTIGRKDLQKGSLFNLCDGGSGSANLSIDVRKKISIANKGRFIGKLNGNYKNKDKYFGKNNPFFNHKHNLKNKMKMCRMYVGYNIIKDKYYLIRGLENFSKDMTIHASTVVKITNTNTQSKGWKFYKLCKEERSYYEPLLNNAMSDVYLEIKQDFLNSNILKFLSYEDINITSNYYGVFKNKEGKYCSTVQVNKEQIYLGLYFTEEMAGLMYNKYIIENNINRSVNKLEFCEDEIKKNEYSMEREYNIKKYNKEYPNINFQSGKWIGRKCINGNRINTGYYNTQKEAYNALQALIKEKGF